MLATLEQLRLPCTTHLLTRPVLRAKSMWKVFRVFQFPRRETNNQIEFPCLLFHFALFVRRGRSNFAITVLSTGKCESLRNSCFQEALDELSSHYSIRSLRGRERRFTLCKSVNFSIFTLNTHPALAVFRYDVVNL